MRDILYFIFGLCFNICRVFKVKRHRAVLMCLHNEGENGALSMLESALNDYGEYEIIWFRREDMFASFKSIIRFFTYYAKMLATANYVFLNDNFMPMSGMHFSDETTVIQLWHGDGVLKRSLLAAEQTPKIRRRLMKINAKLDYLVVTSKGVTDVYEETFGIDRSKIKALGSARLDYFFKADKEEIRNKIVSEFPECRDKKIVLYAPTFRDDKEKNDELLSHFPFEEFSKLSDYRLLVRLHPQAGGLNDIKGGFTNVTDYPSVSELAVASDILITDYSSITSDFAVQFKPVVAYAFDLDYFTEKERGFHFDYESYMPGPVARTPEELINIFKSGDFKTEKLEKFVKYNFDYQDKYNCIRIIEKLVK